MCWQLSTSPRRVHVAGGDGSTGADMEEVAGSRDQRPGSLEVALVGPCAGLLLGPGGLQDHDLLGHLGHPRSAVDRRRRRAADAPGGGRGGRRVEHVPDARGGVPAQAGREPYKTLADPYPRTPAMAAGVADQVRTLSDIARMLDQAIKTTQTLRCSSFGTKVTPTFVPAIRPNQMPG